MHCSITGMSEARLWQGSGPVANKKNKKPQKVSKRTIPLYWTVMYQNICKGEHNFQSAGT